MTDNAPASSHMYSASGFGHGGVGPSYNGIGDQHASTMVRPCSEFAQYGSQYSQYGQGNVRPGYSHGPVMQKEGVIPNRQGAAWGAVNAFQSGCPPGQQQRFMPSGGMHQTSGPHQQQPPQQQQLHPGSAPTLNQLLQSPNSDQRYPGMYGEYTSGHLKTSRAEDVVGPSGGYGMPQPGWTGQQRMALGAYRQQMMCSPMGAAQSSPNQGVPVYDLSRRPVLGMGSRYPPPHLPPPPHHGGAALQNPSQYLSNSQPNSTMNQPGGQMQQQSFSPNHALPPAAHLQPSPSTTPLSQHSDHSSSNIKAQSSPQPTPTAKHKTKKQPKQRQQQSKPQTNVQENSVSEDAFADGGTVYHNAGSNSSHHVVGSQHPNAAPSPAGSVGSRSNTPASLSGNLAGSPSANQLDGQNRILSPLHGQGSGQGPNHNLQQLQQQQQQQQQQMMPPPSMCPSHPGISSGSLKVHAPPHPPPPPHMNAVGLSHQMAPLPYSNVHYNNVHYSSHRGPPGSHTPSMMPGYNGGHPDLPNGPSNHIPGYGSGLTNRVPNYPGCYGNAMDSSSAGQFGGGYGIHPVAISSSGMSASGAITSTAETGHYPSSAAAEHTGVNGKSSASMEDASFSSRPLSSSADITQPSSQPMQSALGNSVMGRVSHSSVTDGGRNPYGMPPTYEMAGLNQQQQQHMMMAFGKSYPHNMTPNPGPGAFTRDHSAGASCEERSQPPSLSAEGVDPGSHRINTAIGVSGMDGSAFLKRAYDGMSFHGDVSHPHHQAHYHPSSHGMSDGMMLPNSHHIQHRSSEDFGPALHPSTHTSMGPPSSSPYMANDQLTPFDAGRALENVSSLTSGANSAGLARDKWIKSEYSHQYENAGRNSISDRDRPRIYDEGSASDTQSSDLGPFPQMTDDSARLVLNSGNDLSSLSGNGSLLNKTLLGGNDDGKKSKATKSKKQKSDKVPGFVVPSPMTPVHDELDDISNASQPATPRSEGNDVLNRLAEMGDEPDRRAFLERLFAFMEDNGTPIVSIPMISKTAVDLYRLYHLVREHGGMVEVTKNKKWRDVSGALNIGPSSSAGFTLKKNYGKHLFGFECRFDRGNVDPVPLLAMLEQPTKKESKKAAAERAAAAAANAQDMYRMSSGQQFGCYPAANIHLQTGLDPGNNPMMMSSSGMVHVNPQQMPYGGPGMMHSAGPGIMPPSGTMPNGGLMLPGMEGGMPPPHGIANASGAGPGLMPPNNGGDTISIQDPFSDVPSQLPGTLYRPGLNYMGASGAGGMMAQRAMYGGAGNMVDGRSQKMPFGSAAAAAICKSPLSSPKMGGSGSGAGAYENSQTDAVDGHGRVVHDAAGNSQDGFPTYGSRAPSESGNSGQRTAMDLAHLAPNRFDQQQQQPLMGAGQGVGHSVLHDEQGHADSSYYRNRQAVLQQRSITDQQVAFSHGYPGSYPINQRILPSPSGTDKYYQAGTAGTAMDAAGQQLYMATPPGCPPLTPRRDMLTPSPQRPPMMKTELRDGYSPCYDARKDQSWMTSGSHVPAYPLNYPATAMLPGVHPPPVYNHSNQLCLSPQKLEMPTYPQPDRKVSALPSRSDILFPPDSVEAIQPRTLKRKRYTHKQLGLSDPWRLMMSLKSGLIVESTSALEILSILLHDDSTVSWFGLQHLPGLVEVLLEHFRRSLTQIFPCDFEDLELGFETLEIIRCRETDDKGKEPVAADAMCASVVTTNSEVQAEDKCVLLSEENNFTMKTRSGEMVVIEENSAEQDLVLDNKKWDVYQEIDSSLFDWQMGRGDTSIHVLTHFNSDISLEFCKKKFFGSRLDKKTQKTTNDNEGTAVQPISNASCTKSRQEADQTEAPVLGKTDEENREEPAAVKVEEESADASDCTVPVGISDHNVDQMDCQKPTEADVEDEARALKSMKRKWTEDEDIEVYQHDNQSLFLVTEAQMEISRRCLCISNIFRGLSFVPGNDSEMSKHPGLLLVLGKLLMLNHIHLKPSPECKKMDATDTDTETGELLIGCDSKARWSSETLEVLREDTLVIFANISGQLDLSLFPEEIVSPILNGLLHWVTCTAACAHDPLPTMPLNVSLSPRRLVLETLCKLCITDSNVDLLLAMPPYSRIVIFLSNLVQLVAESSDQAVREFALVLISSIIQADSSAARAIALHHPSISILLDFIESADNRAMQVVSTRGLAMLKDSPEMMGTSLDMLRRAAVVLLHMAEVPENRTLFARFHHRLLHLVMSQIMDQKVATILAEVLFHSSLS